MVTAGRLGWVGRHLWLCEARDEPVLNLGPGIKGAIFTYNKKKDFVV